MITRDEILKKLKQRKEGLLARYPISELAVFGSYAPNDYNENSDIDILVDFNAPFGIKYIALANELEDIFEKKKTLFRGKEQSQNFYVLLKKI